MCAESSVWPRMRVWRYRAPMGEGERMDQSDIALLRLDTDGRIIEWSAGAVASFGIDRDRALTHSLDEVGLDADAARHVLRTGLAHWVGARSPDRPALLLTPVLEGRETVGAIGIAIARGDIELMQSLVGDPAARMKLIEDNATDWITLNTLDGVMLYSSPASAMISGFTPGELVGHAGYEFIHPDDLSTIMANHGAIADDGAQSTVTYRMRTKSGGYRWVESTTSTVFDEDGRARFILGSTRDIEERRQAEDALRDALTRERAAREQLVDLEAMRARASSIVTDELHGTLQMARALAETMARGEGATEDEIEAAKRLATSLGRSVVTVEQLVGAIKDGLTAPSTVITERADLLSLAAEVIDGLAEPVRQKVSIHSYGYPIGSFDPLHIKRAISEIIAFVLDAGAERAVVGLGAYDDIIRFEVRAWGDADALVPLGFDRAAVLDAGTGDVPPGPFLARAMIERNGGRVGVIRDVEDGATTWFELPALVADRLVAGAGGGDADAARSRHDA